jgi:hypothetical protein
VVPTNANTWLKQSLWFIFEHFVSNGVNISLFVNYGVKESGKKKLLIMQRMPENFEP